MVCSACGYENLVGNRFCGMCGLPLPHRPLTAPGAQGTHSLTRVPLERIQPTDHQPATTSRGQPLAPSRTGVLLEMPSTESRSDVSAQPENAEPSAPDMVPEVPFDEYIKNFLYTPPEDPKEVTMRGDLEVSRPEPRIAGDPPAKAPTATIRSGEASTLLPTGRTEDIGERLGLEDAPAVDERHDRPRFLDFNDPPPKVEIPPEPEATAEVPSFLKLSDIRRVSPQPPAAETVSNLRTVLQGRTTTEEGKSSLTGVLTWLAVAVLIACAALGLLEWRSRVYHTNNGPIEVAKARFQSILTRYDLLSPADSAKPATSPDGEQKSPLSPDQNTAANPNPTTPTVENRPATPADTGAGVGATNSPQGGTTVGPPNSSEQNHSSPTPGSLPNQSQPAAGQKPSEPKPTAPANPKVGSTAAPNVVAATPEKPKPKLATAPEGDQSQTVRKPVPGEEELAKANNASDSAASAAWLWKATAKGNPDAPVRLADMYVKGDGVPRSCEQAVVLLKTAATKENARARNRLGAMYNSGTCVQRNRVEAYRWLSSALAADPNSSWAQQNRELIWQQMTLEERASAQRYR